MTANHLLFTPNHFWATHFGLPAVLVSDAGANFGTQGWLDWAYSWGVRLHMIPAAAQFQNGMA